MYLKNEDVKIGTIPDANGSDTPLRKMEFLTKKEMKDSSRLYGKVIVPPGCALAYHTHENEGEAYHILQGTENIGNEDLVFMALILLDK